MKGHRHSMKEHLTSPLCSHSQRSKCCFIPARGNLSWRWNCYCYVFSGSACPLRDIGLHIQNSEEVLSAQLAYLTLISTGGFPIMVPCVTSFDALRATTGVGGLSPSCLSTLALSQRWGATEHAMFPVGIVCAIASDDSKSSSATQSDLAMRDELTTQLRLMPCQFVVINTAGVVELEKRRPVDTFALILEEKNTGKLEQFFRSYGAAEVAAMCFMLATQSPSLLPQASCLHFIPSQSFPNTRQHNVSLKQGCSFDTCSHAWLWKNFVPYITSACVSCDQCMLLRLPYL